MHEDVNVHLKLMVYVHKQTVPLVWAARSKLVDCVSRIHQIINTESSEPIYKTATLVSIQCVSTKYIVCAANYETVQSYLTIKRKEVGQELGKGKEKIEVLTSIFS